MTPEDFDLLSMEDKGSHLRTLAVNDQRALVDAYSLIVVRRMHGFHAARVLAGERKAREQDAWRGGRAPTIRDLRESVAIWRVIRPTERHPLECEAWPE